MKVLLLNLPHKDKIVRRFMCSYNSPSFLFPPQELLFCAAAVRKWNSSNVLIIDAIAENMNLDTCLMVIDDRNPDMVITMTGIECFGSDIDAIKNIKDRKPNMPLAVFGYYPSIFSKEIMKNTKIDYIIRGEPEICLSQLMKALEKGDAPKGIKGLVSRDRSGAVDDGGTSERIQDLDELPFPDPSMLATNIYSEMLISGPIALMQTSRGCPFKCNYCITTYGRQLIMRSPENVVAEIEFLIKQGFVNIRFTDDTFNVNKQRVSAICDIIIRKKLNIRWTCLSRIDTLDRDLLTLMKKAGCVRIYIGIESFSQKVLDYYDKGYKVSDILERIGWVRRAGIQSTGFLLIGAPIETKEDFEANREGMRRAKLNFVIVTKLTPYPGTPLFNRLRDSMDFSLFPYHNIFKQESKEKSMISEEKELYRVFYWRFSTILLLFKIMLENPGSFFRTGLLFFRFLFGKEEGKEHPDFL